MATPQAWNLEHSTALLAQNSAPGLIKPQEDQVSMAWGLFGPES